MNHVHSVLARVLVCEEGCAICIGTTRCAVDFVALAVIHRSPSERLNSASLAQAIQNVQRGAD
jgi:hypothetical protein